MKRYLVRVHTSNENDNEISYAVVTLDTPLLRNIAKLRDEFLTVDAKWGGDLVCMNFSDRSPDFYSAAEACTLVGNAFEMVYSTRVTDITHRKLNEGIETVRLGYCNIVVTEDHWYWECQTKYGSTTFTTEPMHYKDYLP